MQSQRKSQRTLEVIKPNQLYVWLRDFLLDVRAANRADATIEFYEEKIKRFVEFLDGNGVTDPEGITARQIRAFLVKLGEERSAGGVHAYWRAIRAFIRFLVREDALDRNPLEKVRSPKVDEDLLEPVSMDTVNALMSTCNKSDLGLRDKAILLTLLDTGLRAGEMLSLNVGDVNLTDGSVLVHKTKSRKGRIVFVGRQARKAIAAYLRTRKDAAPNDPFWLAYQKTGEHTRLRYNGLRGIIRRRSEQANVDAPSLHSFRRGFAIAMLRNGADVISLSRLMGHGSLPVLQRYLKQLKTDLGEVHALNSPVDGMIRK